MTNIPKPIERAITPIVAGGSMYILLGGAFITIATLGTFLMSLCAVGAAAEKVAKLKGGSDG